MAPLNETQEIDVSKYLIVDMDIEPEYNRKYLFYLIQTILIRLSQNPQWVKFGRNLEKLE